MESTKLIYQILNLIPDTVSFLLQVPLSPIISKQLEANGKCKKQKQKANKCTHVMGMMNKLYRLVKITSFHSYVHQRPKPLANHQQVNSLLWLASCIGMTHFCCPWCPPRQASMPGCGIDCSNSCTAGHWCPRRPVCYLQTELYVELLLSSGNSQLHKD